MLHEDEREVWIAVEMFEDLRERFEPPGRRPDGDDRRWQ